MAFLVVANVTCAGVLLEALKGSQAVVLDAVAVTVTGTFGSAYSIAVTPNWDTIFWYAAKGSSSFDIQFGTPAPAGATISWFVIKDV